MIDWQVIVDGEFPPGWDQHKDGCWFTDFDMQVLLLPYFDVGKQPIDQYGGTVFDQDDIKRLYMHLQDHREFFARREEKWQIFEKSNVVSNIFEVNRDDIVKVLDKTIEICKKAIEMNGQILFRGD